MTYWVRDQAGRVLGPVGLHVVKELVKTGRLLAASQISSDGRTWRSIDTVPELAALLQAAKAPRQSADLDEAARVEADVRRLTGKPPREVLGVPAAASIEQARLAFFSRVKLFHPSRLRPDAHDDLRRAYDRMYQLLTAAMQALEREQRASKPSAAPAPTYEPKEFGGWERGPDQRVRVHLDINLQNADVLIRSSAANATNQGFFLPTRKSLPLFEVVDVTLRFDGPRREIHGQGRVVHHSDNPPGLGIRFLSLGDEDKRFLDYFAKKAQLGRTSR